MAKKKKENGKKRFEVEEGETIDQCLARISEEGYMPIRRNEEPVFQEKDGEMEPTGRRIVFEAKKSQ
ncbi:NETI motif-containing protein [Salimicrobium flavidum]|uniref:NETI protein n=1 Tax=Salimicrobium flavidum TaxID=570947 RepID=A0A1N7KCE3_9BACI|nr:NETI motif-containing protein [Salimicrobium flavidum]SIS59242.1 NETI protein [Salimicrobium flavidum]